MDDKNYAECYMDESDIVEDLLLYQLTENDKRVLRDLDPEELISLHHSMGQDIRNYYRLWETDNPFVTGCGKHADDVSMRVLELAWSRLTNKPVPKKPEIVDNGNGTYTIGGVDIQIFSIHTI